MRAALQHLAPHFMFAIGVGLMALGAYQYFAAAPGPALTPVETDLEVSGGVAGQEQVVELRFENRSRRPIRVLGMGFC